MSARRDGTPLWLVRGPNGMSLFAGSLEAMAAHIAALHRATGVQHFAREIGA